MFEITNKFEEEEFISDHNRIIIFFGSDDCGHCRYMIPIVKRFEREYPTVSFAHVEITKVDVENVDQVPLFIGYRNQIAVDTVLGADPELLRDMIVNKIL